MSYSQNPNPVPGTIEQESISSAAGLYLVPFIAEMAVDADGEIGVTKRVAVTITNIDAMFDVSMNEADSVKLLNAFSIKDSDSNGNLNATDASSGSIVDVYAPNTDKGAAFRAALRSAILRAMSASTYEAVGATTGSVASRSVQEYVRFQGYSDTLNALMANTLAGLLEANDLNSFNVEVDASGGAFKMVELMSADPDDATKTAGKYRRAILTQLPEANIEKYAYADQDGTALAVEDVSGMNLLPLVDGDKMVFVFDVTIGDVAPAAKEGNYWTAATDGAAISRVVIDRYGLPAQAGTTNTLGGLVDVKATTSNEYAEAASSLTFIRPSKRRIAIRTEVNTNSGDAAFKVKVGSAVFNPNDAEFKYASSAGLLTKQAGAIMEATTEIWSAATPVVSVTPTEGSLTIDTTGGVKSVDVATTLTPPTLGEDEIGDWLVINDAGNVNSFEYVKADNKIVYTGRSTTLTNDTATLFYVTNKGKSTGIDLIGSASLETQA